MVMTHLRSGLVLLILSNLSGVASAEVAGNAPAAEAWAREWSAAGKDRSKTLAGGRVLFVQPVKGGVKLIGSDAAAARKSIPLPVASQDELDLAAEINRPLVVEEDAPRRNPCLASSAVAATCFDADFVLEMGKSKWRLSRFDRSTGKLRGLREAAAGDSESPEKWISAQIRYDGVIVDVKDNFYLAAVVVKNDRTDFQALAIKNSESLEFLPQNKNTNGSALLAAVSVWNGFATFKIVTGDALPVGTKLVIEGSKSK